MRRLLVFALAFSLADASFAFAGESLLTAATRLAREAARAATPAPSPTPAAPASRAQKAVAFPSFAARAAVEQTQPGLATSGMSRTKKILLGIAAGVGFAAVAYTIDHKVLDVTPSTLGTRED